MSKFSFLCSKKESSYESMGIRFCRLGMCLYAREYLKYNSWFIIPGISIDIINGYDFYIDIEVKSLFFGFGIRIFWIKK